MIVAGKYHEWPPQHLHENRATTYTDKPLYDCNGDPATLGPTEHLFYRIMDENGQTVLNVNSEGPTNGSSLTITDRGTIDVTPATFTLVLSAASMALPPGNGYQGELGRYTSGGDETNISHGSVEVHPTSEAP